MKTKYVISINIFMYNKLTLKYLRAIKSKYLYRETCKNMKSEFLVMDLTTDQFWSFYCTNIAMVTPKNSTTHFNRTQTKQQARFSFKLKSGQLMEGKFRLVTNVTMKLQI